METIDVQSRSFVIRWVGGIQGDEIEYQVKPLKKSVKLEIYKKPRSSLTGNSPSSVHIVPDTKALLDYKTRSLSNRNLSAVSEGKTGSDSSSSTQEPRKSLSLSNIQRQSQELPLPERLATSGFTLVKSVGVVAGNKRESGLLTVKNNDYYYAFVLDNTYSKNAKKKILFSAAVVSGVETRTTRSMKFPKSPALPQDTSFTLSQQEGVLRVGQGRYLQGFLFKKRRKKHQGFKKRFFSLDYKYGTLFYYLNERNQTCRGEIVISISTVSANKKDKLIIIDSGMELWVLKAKDIATWKIWVEALQSCFDQLSLEGSASKEKHEDCLDHSENSVPLKPAKQSDLQSTAVSDYTPLPDVSYEEFALHLKLLQQRIEECRKESLSYTPREREPRMQPASRASSSSSTEERAKEHPLSASDSTESIASITNNVNSAVGHPLYQKLCEIESTVAKFVQQNQILLRDHQQVSKQNRGHQATTVSLLSNEEYFDAAEDNEHGVIMLDVDDTDENTNDTPASPMDFEHNFTKFDKGFQQHSETHFLPEPPQAYKSPLQERPASDRSPLQEQLPTFNVLDAPEINHSDASHSDKDLYPLPLKEFIKRRDDVRAEATTPPSFLAFMRKNVGKDLSSIAMPVTANEPITILQIVAEMFEYAELLSVAARSSDSSTCLKYVSAFAVSCLSIYRDKTRALRKPFTPLLTETFELVREDIGFRLIAEKVSHKPLILAIHAEHTEWECNYTVMPIQKFWGKSVELNNEGTVRLKFKKSGETFEWVQPTTMLKNLIAGERYIEPINEFEIQSSSGGKATVAFRSAGMFGGRSEDFTISAISPSKEKNELTGKWTESLKESKTQQIIWEVGKLVPDCKKKYGFTVFTSNLNQITGLEKDKLPPTDSRLRPDLRAYENGQIDEAETLKLKLEKDQRDRRTRGEDAKPQFFKKVENNEWKIIRGPQNYWERRKRQDWGGITPLW
ncbi:related to Oxysterol-binding protein homolog 3 [Zygosaccharomyces bailii ISA1307]|nr:related to Oxysterol-binding protein homolog 3 [Zygosaccharomyces bailii ISA1307]